MKRVLGVFLALMLSTTFSFAAFTPSVTVLGKTEIAKLTDEELIDRYLDTIVEVEASRSFHTTSGFNQKDYTEYKSLIKFRLLLQMEIHSRNLELPHLERP